MPQFQMLCRRLKQLCVLDNAQGQCGRCILLREDCQFLGIGQEGTLNAEMGTPVERSISGGHRLS
jgi:hypothetical protein